MSTITAILEPSEDGTLHLPAPDELKSKRIRVVATLEAAELLAPGKHPLRGIWEGEITYKPDWDAPLDDFKR